MKKIAIILITGLILSSCHTKEPWELEVEEQINQLNGDTEVTEINLDLMDPVAVEPDVLLRLNTSGDVNMGVPRDIIALKDSLYLLDQAQKSILVLDDEGNFTRKIDKAGRGPGEVTRPTGMAANEKFIFVYDHGNTRLHMYDRYFNALSSMGASPNPFSRSVSVADSLLYIIDTLRKNAGEVKLIKQYSIYPELKEKGNLVPRLLPPGRQPAVINDVEFGANAAGYLLVGYDSLPRLFLYDPERKLMHSLRFSGSPVEEVNRFNERNKREHRLDPGSTLGLAPFVYSVLLDNDFNIYLFTVGHNLLVLSLKNNTYELSGSYILEHPEGGGRRESLIIFGDRLFLLYENFPEDILVYNLKRLLQNVPL